MMRRTHELKIYASAAHKTARSGELILHLWFNGAPFMQMDLDIALNRPDVLFVEEIDCINHVTVRHYADPTEKARRS